VFLLDTNVISEPTKQRPSPDVLAWLANYPGKLLFMSVISLGELMQGLERLPSSARKQQLILWLNSLSQNAFRGGRKAV
jgi:hypothetical protein